MPCWLLEWLKWIRLRNFRFALWRIWRVNPDTTNRRLLFKNINHRKVVLCYEISDTDLALAPAQALAETDQ